MPGHPADGVDGDAAKAGLAASMVLEIAVAVTDSADLFDDEVDGVGGSVAGAINGRFAWARSVTA